MLPSPERFLEGFAFFARRHAPLAHIEEAPLLAALAEAEALAAGREEDEPAALFYACARRSRAFGPLARDFVPFITRRQAHAVGWQLEAEDVVLDILRTRVVLAAITFDELRAELSVRRRTRA
jgi:hypothetical protein